MVELSLTNIGLGFTIIVGGSAIVAYLIWLLTTYRYPVDGRKILPLYLVAIGMQFIHLTEEYVADFPDNFSALTGSHLSPNAFVLIAILAGGVAYLFAGFGLIHRHPVANYVVFSDWTRGSGEHYRAFHVSIPCWHCIFSGSSHCNLADDVWHRASLAHNPGRSPAMVRADPILG